MEKTTLRSSLEPTIGDIVTTVNPALYHYVPCDGRILNNAAVMAVINEIHIENGFVRVPNLGAPYVLITGVK